MGQSIIKNPRKIVSQLGGGGGVDPALEARVEYLEQNEYKITYYTEINAATGTITKPTGSTILTDQFFGGIDAYVSTIANGQPTGNFPTTAGGVEVDVTSFDASGNFTLSGTPSAYPCALIYKLTIAAVDYQNLVTANILDMEGVNDVTLTGIQTLTNKRITRRVTTIVSNATPTVNTDDYDMVEITALAAAITSMTTNLSGTPTNGQLLQYQIKDNGTARAITWGASFEAKGQALPTTTTISKRLNVLFTWDTTTSKWGCLDAIVEA